MRRLSLCLLCLLLCGCHPSETRLDTLTYTGTEEPKTTETVLLSKNPTKVSEKVSNLETETTAENNSVNITETELSGVDNSVNSDFTELDTELNDFEGRLISQDAELNASKNRLIPYTSRPISDEGKMAIQTLIADYLKSEQDGIEDNPVIWEDFEKLYETTDNETADVWVNIVTEWDKAIKGEFMENGGDKRCYVVLGYRLNPDGTADTELLERLDKAVSLMERDSLILCSGKGSVAVSEASVMKAYLIQKGIDPSRILTEERSRDTIENVLYSCPILEENGISDIVLITSSYHLTGAAELFSEMFLLSGSPIKVSGAVGSHSDKNAFSNDVLAKWMYNLFLQKSRRE